MENNIIPQSEKTKDKEEVVEDLYKLETKPAVEDGFYKLRVVEFEQEESTFENFELIKITHPEDTEVGVINNRIVTYKDLIEPKEITGVEIEEDIIKRDKGESIKIKFEENLLDGHDLMVSKTSLRAGDRRLDEVEDIFKDADKGAELDFLHLIILATFLATPIAMTQSWSVKYSIYFYEYKANGKEKEVGVVHPRERMSEQLIELPAEEMDSLELSLKWTETHKIKPLGLARKTEDFTRKEVIECEKMTELKKDRVGEDINGSLKLTPGEGATLYFPASDKKKKKGEKTTYLLKSKGFYNAI